MNKDSYPRRFKPSPLLAVFPIVFVLAGYAIYTIGFAGPIKVEGTIKDAASGTVVANARIAVKDKSSSGQASAEIPVGPDGTYVVDNISTDSTLRLEADGYEPREFTVNRSEKRSDALRPVQLSGKVLDSFANSPITSASVSLADKTVSTDAGGSYQIIGAKKGNPLTVAAQGYATATVPYEGQATLDLRLRPNTLGGAVKDAGSGNPIKNALVQVAGQEATTTEAGTYRLVDLPAGPITMTVTAPGYVKAVLAVKEKTQQDVQLRQFAVRGLYLTYYGIADQGLRSGALSKIEKSEANAVVIDVKGDLGFLVYKTDVPLAKKIGSADNPTVKDFDALMADLKKKNIYTIARIVTFKDNPLATSRPDLATIDTRTGKPWIDRENLAWVDPTRQEVWDYNLAIAKEAAKKGFDEIQFDYIRFPTDGSVTTARYSRPNTMENRLDAINGFLSRAKAQLKPLGVAISIDVFGYTCWREDDMGIGQKIEEIGKYVDFISPMVYPSTYSDGIPDYRNAVAYPYEIVYYSLKKAGERLAGMPVKLRPWLQYFDDYPWATGMLYNAREIQAQKKAAADAKVLGWLMWDPTNRYARGGLDPK
ncbi:MAG: carboxypeptidase regulatory-like domain-containing protein [Chloroflexi bacterium]|nr:carboxypeptidase regulatory-like domain-containing protein [Chloroflexota bacterium]